MEVGWEAGMSPWLKRQLRLSVNVDEFRCWDILGGRRVGTYVERDEGARGRDGLVLPKTGRAVPNEAQTKDETEGKGQREEGRVSISFATVAVSPPRWAAPTLRTLSAIVRWCYARA